MTKYLTFIDRDDGFGAQYQSIIFTILYAYFNNFEYVNKKIKAMEIHENEFEKINNFINLHNNYLNIENFENIDNIEILPFSEIYGNVEKNIDYYTTNNPCIQKIKECFWKNKDKNFYNNNKKNIAVHVRRPNIFNTRINGSDTPHEYYLNVMNIVRNKNHNKDLLFHIYSQGSIENFDCYKNNDVVLHIDEEITSTFTGFVSADVLILSESSFSYTAALLSDGEIYYLPWWHPPKKEWIIV